MKKNAFSLIELLIVVIIVGILAVLLLPRFQPAKEGALNDEARANLRLIQAAEKIYRLEAGCYTTAANETEINERLKLSIPENRNSWNYTIDSATSSTFTAKAVRNIDSTSPYKRTFTIDENVSKDPVCQSGFCN